MRQQSSGVALHLGLDPLPNPVQSAVPKALSNKSHNKDFLPGILNLICHPSLSAED